MQLCGVPVRGPKVFWGIGLQSNGLGESFLNDALDFAYDMLELDFPDIAFHSTGKIENLSDNVGPPLCACSNDRKNSLNGIIWIAEGQALNPHNDGGEHVVQVVGDSTGESSKAFKPLG